MNTAAQLKNSLSRKDLSRTQRTAIHRALQPLAGVNVYLTGLRAAGLI